MVGQRKTKAAKAKACPKDSSIKKALRVTSKSPSKKPDDDLRPEQVTKGHQSGFLMFCKSAKEAQDPDVREQAESVLMEYYKPLSRMPRSTWFLPIFEVEGSEVDWRMSTPRSCSASLLRTQGAGKVGWHLVVFSSFKGVPGARDTRWKTHNTRGNLKAEGEKTRTPIETCLLNQRHWKCSSVFPQQNGQGRPIGQHSSRDLERAGQWMASKERYSFLLLLPCICFWA